MGMKVDKAALRAAENSIRELKPEKQISFLFLPDKEDPDSYVINMAKTILLILQNKANYLFINLFLVIIKNKLKIILLQWLYLRKN